MKTTAPHKKTTRLAGEADPRSDGGDFDAIFQSRNFM
jgi:hypothetical protein